MEQKEPDWNEKKLRAELIGIEAIPGKYTHKISKTLLQMENI